MTTQLQIGDVIQGDETWTVWSDHGNADMPDVFLLKQEGKSPVRDRSKITNVRLSDQYNRMFQGSIYKTAARKKIAETGLNLVGTKFVVIDAKMTGGGPDGRGTSYGDGWHVTAQQLNDDNSYDDNAPKIAFYQSDSFVCSIIDVKPIGQMQRTVTYAPMTPPAGMQ